MMRFPIRTMGASLVVAGLMAAAWTESPQQATPAGEPAPLQEIRFRSGPARLSARPADALQDQVDALVAGGVRHIVAQFDAPLATDARDAIRAAGFRLLTYIGDHAYFAAVDANADTAAAAAAGLRAVSPIETEWKLETSLREGIVHPWMIVPPATTADGKYDPALDKNPANPDVGVYILFHADVDLDADAVAIAHGYGANVRSMLRAVNGLVIELPFSNIFDLAFDDSVQWIEPPLPQFTELNDSNRARVQANTVQAPPYGLDGSGVSVLVYDAGTGLPTHQDFGGRLHVRDTSGLASHSTHVAGTVGGSGAASGGTFAGMAPGVTIESYGFEQEGGLMQGFLYTDPGDIEVDYGEAITVYNADIANNSIGTNTARNGYPCDWEGNYGVTGALIDSIAAGFFGGEEFPIVWANGNERGSGRCGTTYLTTAPPACAKNHITVGALNSDDDSVTSFTSWGYTDDGRLKPDISAPGCQNDGDGGVTSCNSASNTSYTVFCGTSMAAPTTCGVGALLLQDFRNQYPGEPDFSAATLKVLLAHSAQDIEEPGPDFKTGYGSIRAPAAVDLLRSGNFLEAEVDQGGTYSFLVIATPGQELKVTLAWSDVPGTPNVDPVLVNDLDLQVFAPDGSRQYPYTLSTSNPSAPAIQTAEDHVNNIEQVYVASAMAGAYRVEVHGFNVPQGPQSFSVAGTPQLVNCSSQGTATLGAARFPCASTANVSVIDCDLNTDDNVIETVSVVVASDSEPAGETILLTESGPETSKFDAMLPLSITDGAGVLQVADGDTITLTYIDADDGLGGMNVTVNAFATVDCTPPVISNVQVTDVRPRSALVTFDTDEPANGSVRFGTDCGTLGAQADENGFGTTHSVMLTGLTDQTDYNFVVDATDRAGNTATDDPNGCYGFMTPDIPDFFTEQFAAGIDVAGNTITFVPSAGVDQYVACVEPINALPTDPAGGTALSLTDDSSAEVFLGTNVVLYGQSYGSVHVGSNGALTFTSGNTDYTETLEEHFAAPRISALWDDLNPTVHGSVSYRELPDRFVVTYDGIAEYNTTNMNTFQVEMFYNGQITLSYLGIDLADAIIGLSEGLGLDPDYFSSDLSGVGNCGPRPPSVTDILVETVLNTPVNVTLLGSDDGMPGPLTYSITSLPTRGTLTDVTSGLPVGAVPYALAGNEVEYQPNNFQTGVDTFDYIADDGGTPPDGGQSDPATVTVQIASGAPEVVYSFPLDTDPGWTTEGDWAFGQPTGGGTHNLDPISGFTGDNVYGYNLAGDYPNAMPRLYLTTTAIDMTDMLESELRFWRWLGVESSSFDHAGVEVSNDGSNWVSVWEHTGGSFSDASWSQMTFDISAVADNQPTVYIRWAMGTTDGSVTYPGWNIDDIEIVAIPPLDIIPGDLDGDCDVDLADLAVLLSAFGQSGSGNPADINGDGVVDLVDLALLLANFGGSC